LIDYSPSPSRQLLICIRAKLSEKSLTAWRGNVKEWDEDEATPTFDDKSNTNNNEEGSKMRASIDAKLEDLMKRLEKLTAENNKLRRKIKVKRLKTKEGSSSSKEDSSYEEEDSMK
jgi:predicted metal-dependent hydrolase